jgi:hypothetical protein
MYRTTLQFQLRETAECVKKEPPQDPSERDQRLLRSHLTFFSVGSLVLDRLLINIAKSFCI